MPSGLPLPRASRHQLKLIPMHKDHGDALVELIKSRRRLRQPDYAPNSIAMLEGRLRLRLFRNVPTADPSLSSSSPLRRHIRRVVELAPFFKLPPESVDNSRTESRIGNEIAVYDFIMRRVP